MNIFLKIYTWIKANLASILGIAQAAIKGLKEVLTAIVNLISIFIPAFAAQSIVLKIRLILNAIDEFIEKYKDNLIPDV